MQCSADQFRALQWRKYLASLVYEEVCEVPRLDVGGHQPAGGDEGDHDDPVLLQLLKAGVGVPEEVGR